MPGIGNASVDAVKMTTESLHMTVHLTHTRELKFRIWLAMLLIRVAAWIMPASVTIEDEGIKPCQE